MAGSKKEWNCRTGEPHLVQCNNIGELQQGFLSEKRDTGIELVRLSDFDAMILDKAVDRIMGYSQEAGRFSPVTARAAQCLRDETPLDVVGDIVECAIMRE